MFKSILRVTALSAFLSTAVFADIDTPQTGDTDSKDFGLIVEHNGVVESLSLYGSVFSTTAHTVDPLSTSTSALGRMGVRSAATANFTGQCKISATTASGPSGSGIGSLQNADGDKLSNYNIILNSGIITGTTFRTVTCNDTSSSGSNTIFFRVTDAPFLPATAGTYTDTVTLTLTIG
jgi:hypothetical protein